MKTFVMAFLAGILLVGNASADDRAVSKSTLARMGLAGIEQLSDRDGLAVRGKGPFDSLVLPRDIGVPNGFTGPKDLGLPSGHTFPGDLGIPNDFVLPKDLGLRDNLVLPPDLGLPSGGFGGNPWGM